MTQKTLPDCANSWLKILPKGDEIQNFDAIQKLSGKIMYLACV